MTNAAALASLALVLCLPPLPGLGRKLTCDPYLPSLVEELFCFPDACHASRRLHSLLPFISVTKGTLSFARIDYIVKRAKNISVLRYLNQPSSVTPPSSLTLARSRTEAASRSVCYCDYARVGFS
ncbi:hypothetical protein E2C01_056626 [Portunus trituberculatus]|uniref:Uncharacterized protein n=1 Tax=Portunus trituberculatus TaxID=210409 RepID=A0A5B7GQV0_PORTR|nr:hypothetical protein [Portunus trituberculatus]